MKEKNRFAIMKKEFHDSQHIKIPKHINECRVEVKKAQQTKNSKRKSSFKVFSQINEKPNSKAIILPQMETKDHPSTNCLVVDLLQLADSYSQGFKYKHIEQRLGNSLGKFILSASSFIIIIFFYSLTWRTTWVMLNSDQLSSDYPSSSQRSYSYSNMQLCMWSIMS